MNNKTKSILCGILASSILLGVYFTVLTLVSGWNFTQKQFVDYWYFVVGLAVGFGIMLRPEFAALLMSISSIIVATNAVLLKRVEKDLIIV